MKVEGKKMKPYQIVDLMNKIQGATFAGMDCLTNVKLKGGKKNPQQGRITKRHYGARVMLFTNKMSNGYENMVRRRLQAEGKDPESFVLGELQWGKRISNSPLIEHKGNYYIQCIFLAPGDVQYLLDGEPIDKADIIGLDEKREGSGRQGLEDEHKVVVRTYALPSIRRLRMFKEERVDGEAPSKVTDVVDFEIVSEEEFA